ncbi:MAG: CDP-diacylglycerol--serine O-phosphatidyltransferase [Deltaproteobacteria bacterium]|nr:CDP-diacylglycerol--serine O-phosphatidyltransferase [Deltaproteobacteria bacterium]
MNLRKTLFILPNLFTLSSIYCGFEAIRRVSEAPSPALEPQPYYQAALLLVFAMFFDTIDGRVARLTKTQSAFGVQIDSLADVVSFGVAPAILLYRWALMGLGAWGSFVSFVFLACGAIRLARFNVLATAPSGEPTKPSKFILGLPIPGAAGVILALIIANHSVRGTLFAHRAVLVAVSLALSVLMVSTVRFRSFKDLRFTTRTVASLALGLSSTAFIATKFGPAFALPYIMAVYIAIAVIESVVTFPKRRAERRAERTAQPASKPDDKDP